VREALKVLTKSGFALTFLEDFKMRSFVFLFAVMVMLFVTTYSDAAVFRGRASRGGCSSGQCGSRSQAMPRPFARLMGRLHGCR
jgi:hypothetical protein